MPIEHTLARELAEELKANLIARCDSYINQSKISRFFAEDPYILSNTTDHANAGKLRDALDVYQNATALAGVLLDCGDELKSAPIREKYTNAQALSSKLGALPQEGKLKLLLLFFVDMDDRKNSGLNQHALDALIKLQGGNRDKQAVYNNYYRAHQNELDGRFSSELLSHPSSVGAALMRQNRATIMRGYIDESLFDQACMPLYRKKILPMPESSKGCTVM